MLLRFSKLLMALVSVVLAGCVTTYKPVTELPLEEYDSMRVVSVVPQEEIRVQINPSAAGEEVVGGFLGWAIDAVEDNSRAEDAEKSSEKFRVALRDHDVPVMIHQSIESEIANLQWSDIKSFESFGDFDIEQDLLTNEMDVPPDTILHISSHFVVTPKFETIEIAAYYKLYEVVEDPWAENGWKTKKIYENQAVYQAEVFLDDSVSRPLTEEEIEKAKNALVAEYNRLVEEADGDTDRIYELRSEYYKKNKQVYKQRIPLKPEYAYGSRWLRQDARLLFEAINEGVRELGQLILMDLEGQGGDLKNYESEWEGKVIAYDLPIETQREDGKVIRVLENQPGKLLSLPGKIVSRHADSEYFSLGEYFLSEARQ